MSALASPSPRTAALTAAAMLAFAANSVLCRLALGVRSIDPVSFSAIRLAAGALVLIAIVRLRSQRRRGSLRSGLALALYALPFSLAFVSLSAGTGALVLFAAVQTTMIIGGLHAGERPRPQEWVGLALALCGLVVLVAPGLSRPSPAGLALMVVAGIAWGAYSLRGRRSLEPTAETAGNFLYSLPFAALALVPAASHVAVTMRGVALALLSGAVTSALGYVIWYTALAGLTATRAALVQLVVPVLAAAGGALVLREVVTLRLLVAAVLILGGVALAIRAKASPLPAAVPPDER